MTNVTDYLCVDRYLTTLNQGVSLQAAFELGFVDIIAEHPGIGLSQLQTSFPGDAVALQLLLTLLKNGDIISTTDSGYFLTPGFLEALSFREIMQAKLEFAAMVASDFTKHFSKLLINPEEFFQQSRLFEIFDYSRAFEKNESNFAHTQRWVNITSALTHYEAKVCMVRHDFSSYRNMLDYGGNSGEFALQLCRQNPQLSATILDLPVVCDVAHAHIKNEAEVERIGFIEVGADTEIEQYDLITFKSMLHDWPEGRVEAIIKHAHEMLKPGGTLLIFERGPYDPEYSDMGYGNLPLMLFFRSYRGAELYKRIVDGLGMKDIKEESLQLEMPFVLITAKKLD